MTSQEPSNRVVHRFVAAINDGDRDAFPATLTDDGNPRSLRDRIDREIFSAHRHMNIEQKMAGLPQSEISHPARRHIRGYHSQPGRYWTPLPVRPHRESASSRRLLRFEPRRCRRPRAPIRPEEDSQMATSLANTQSRAELSASRARIVAAADETRRRLERDLHDGIQQRLVSLGLKAQMIQTMTPRPADNIQRELSLLADGLVTALDELREIARGIHPAVLSEAGLGPALEALARRSAVPVELDLDLGSPPGQQAEVAAYYTASEALANAAKHARASVIDLRVRGDDSALALSIRDDGIGGADPSRGSGITGLKDRVEALGGTISVLSPPGHGTTLHVRLPAGPAPWPARTAAGEKTPLQPPTATQPTREPEGYRPACRWLPRREATHAASEADPP